MKTTIFLTGSNGFLGTQIALHLLRHTDGTIIALLRARNREAAQQRLNREWWDWPELRAALGNRIEALPGDITFARLGLSSDDFHSLAQRVTHIIHAAADVRLNAPLETLREVNVNGTRQVLTLARAINQSYPLQLQRFSHISTAYVCGERSGPIAEADLSDHTGFSNAYERSKYEAEMLVHQAASEMPVSIFRPGMIVGDSSSGAIKTFNTLYYPLRLYMTGKMRLAPASPAMRINLVPVDFVATAIQKLTFDPLAAGQTFHLTPPFEDMPTLAEITDTARDWMRNQYGINLPLPIFLPFTAVFTLLSHPVFNTHLKKMAGHDLVPLLGLLDYFKKQPIFLRENTDRLLGAYPHRWLTILPPLLAFAVKQSFWHRSSRTVFEQIFFRLQSQSKPVIFHDLILDKSHPEKRLQQITRSSAEMHAEILAAARAIQMLNIQPGGRVAIIGFNNSRYISMLVACGLTGVVSVPLYPTAPLEEIKTLLNDCHASLLLTNVPEILDHLAEINFDGPVVSFCTNETIPQDRQQYFCWQEFLSLGIGQAGSFTPVALDAVAALFYTSGTTGKPKAVEYRHEQLRWLAETLASNYPWRERNRRGAYLSCLPMSHVVEGILATYSPYYVPAALDLYFLEDFQALPAALKIARPTIFFSVPRFFEKVRAAFLQNRLARFYLRLPQNKVHAYLRPILRRGLLQKSGLNGCKQLLVGSAHMPLELLLFYRDLGIEVHNAYGLTEAPLVSINRLGRNKPGTVGELLPETTLRFGAEGEILVSGPQVASGYHEKGNLQAFPEGWFETGDTGSLSADGYLNLTGRKKDMIITAYGENIAPLPLESQLRAIPGVAEGLIAGDGRPYCVALLWLEETSWNNGIIPIITAGIGAINAGLEKPAQVKRWAIIRGSLTVANGFLSGSMKVKRAFVMENMSEIIEAIYQNKSMPEILYCQMIQRD